MSLIVLGFAVLCAALPGRASAGQDRLSLVPCGKSPRVECGRLSVPLDWQARHASPRIDINFRFQPASDGHARGTLVAVEGGPGYPSTQSAGFYAQMFGADLRTHNLLLVDNRGTGSSTPIDCPALQSLSALATPVAVQAAAGACGRSLDHRWRWPDGAWVHASDLFSSVAAGDDLAAIIAALGTGPVDIYGDSYGTYFVQVFADQHPRLVSAVVLDSAYQVRDLDPWYRSTIVAMRSSVDTVCQRALACRATITNAWSEISQLTARLDRRPAVAEVPDQNGRRMRVRVTTVGLVNLLNDAGDDTSIYQTLPAAARALVVDDDAAPLARLFAQRLAEDEDYGGPADQYSAGLYLAVGCTDYPQLFSMEASAPTRAAELARAVRRLGAGTFAPFSTRQWMAQNFNTEAYSACLSWPAPDAGALSARTLPPRPLPRRIHVLILSGALDIWTPAAGDPAVARQIGGVVQTVSFANATHVVADANTLCGDAVVAAFAADPRRLADPACAAHIPAIHALGSFPADLAAVPALTVSDTVPGRVGRRGQRDQRGRFTGTSPAPEDRLAVAAVDTAGDALARWEAIQDGEDSGLHGGRVSANPSGTVLRLRADELIPGVTVSGVVEVDRHADGSESVQARLLAHGPGVGRGSFTAVWTNASLAEARITGRLGGRVVRGETPAP